MIAAIKLVKECGATDFTNCGGESQVTYMLHTKQLEAFYRAAQVQALREAADLVHADYGCDADSAAKIRRMADELEKTR